MLHSREFAFSATWIRVAKIIRNDQTQHRVAQKLERLVVKFTSLLFVSGRNFFVSPGTMSNGTFEQSTIVEVVSKNRLEEVEIRNRFGIFQNTVNYNKRRKLVEKLDRLPALERLLKELRYWR